MTIYFFKDNEMIEAIKDDYDYRDCESSPLGVVPKYFIEHEILCFWHLGLLHCTDYTGLKAKKQLEKIKDIEFAEWVENRCPYPFYYAKDYDEAMALHLQNDRE